MLQSQKRKANNQILNKKNQEIQEKIITPSPKQLITNVIQELQNMIKEYIEKMSGMFNNLATLITRIT